MNLYQKPYRLSPKINYIVI